MKIITGFSVLHYTIKDTELLLSKLCDQQNVPFKILKESVNITLDKHAPLKKDMLELISPFL